MDDLTYSISLKGEQHTYTVEAWLAVDADALCAILADLTGYRADYLRRELPGQFDRFGYALVHPAACGFGEVPGFAIASSTGAKMPAAPDARELRQAEDRDARRRADDEARALRKGSH